MIALGNGRWVKELALPPGVHEYRLVVDGEWMADPRAAESAPNPFGGLNSIVRILPEAELAEGAGCRPGSKASTERPITAKPNQPGRKADLLRR